MADFDLRVVIRAIVDQALDAFDRVARAEEQVGDSAREAAQGMQDLARAEAQAGDNARAAARDAEELARAEAQVDDSAREAAQGTQDLGDGVASAGGIFERVKALALEFGKALVAAFTIKTIYDFLDGALRLNLAMDDLRDGLADVTGSAELAEQKFNELRDLAENSPFVVDELTAAYTDLHNYGLAPTREVMTTLTNAAAKLEDSSRKLSGMTDILGRAWAEGKLSADALFKLVDMGIPALELMARATGKSSEEILAMAKQGQLGRESIAQLTDELGRFASGENEKALATIGGRFDQLKEAWSRFVDNLAGGRTMAAIKTVSGWIQNMVQAAANAIDWLDVKINGASSLSQINSEIDKLHANIARLESKPGRGDVRHFDELDSGTLDRYKAELKALEDKRAAILAAQAAEQKAFEAQKNAPPVAEPETGRRSPAAPRLRAAPRTPAGPSEESLSRAEMGRFDEGLDAYRQAFERQNALRELSKQDEKKYWDDIIATYTGSSLTRAELVKKSAELDVAIIREQAREKQALLAESIEAEQAAALDAVAVKEQAAQQEFALGQISQAQLLTQQENFEREKFDIARRYLQQKRELIVDDRQAYERSLNEEKALLRKHAADLTDIHNKMAIDHKESISKWFGPLESALDGAVNGLLQGTQTTAQALQNTWNSLVVAYIQALAKMALRRAADWTAELIGFRMKETTKTAIKTQAETAQAGAVAANQTAQAGFVAAAESAKTGAVVVGEATRGAAESAGAKQSVLLVAWRAMKNIAIYALEAAAGVYASVSSIPYVGWILAPIAAAVTFIAVMGYGAMVSSSAGGEWQVSEDGKPYILHKNETVLPAHIATPLREMVEGRRASPEQIVTEKIAAGVKPLLGASAGSGYGLDEARVRGARPGNGAIVTADNVLQSMQAMQAGQTRQAVTANFNVNAIDTQSVRQFFNAHGGEIVNTLNRQGRKFNFGGAK
jgi:tape measure domain-containing protein